MFDINRGEVFLSICTFNLLILDDQKCVILLAIRLNLLHVFINGIYSLSCFTGRHRYLH